VVIELSKNVLLTTAAVALVATSLSGPAFAQDEADRIKALEQMIQKQQSQIEAQQKALDEMRSALKSVQESGQGDGSGRNRVVLSRDDRSNCRSKAKSIAHCFIITTATKTPSVMSTATRRPRAWPLKVARKPPMI
jgi:uncharacterized coiled-coil protein SlyX